MGHVETKRIVVIGGGIVGSSAALHLVRNGALDVTLVDAGQPGAATTGAGAGFVSHWSAGMLPEVGRPGYLMQDYALEFYRGFQGIGYLNNGTLMMALSEEGREAFVQPVLDSPFAPPEMRNLGPEEIGRLMFGLVDPEKVHSAAFNPHGIQIETGLANAAIVAECAALGGKIMANCRVTSAEQQGDSVCVRHGGDKHGGGEIVADTVILAAGAWNNAILAGLGLSLPMLRVVATRIVTADCGLPPNLPTVQCRELGLWLREKAGAICWGTGQGYAPLYELGGEVAPGQPRDRELLDRLLAHQAQLEPIFPPLGGTGPVRWHQGMPCYTPDNRFYLGPVAGHGNLFVGGGDNETGVTHGPGMGRILAEYALDQTPFVDTAGFDPNRFAAGAFPSEADVAAVRPVRPTIRQAAP